jgi:hypothetical protein
VWAEQKVKIHVADRSSTPIIGGSDNIFEFFESRAFTFFDHKLISVPTDTVRHLQCIDVCPLAGTATGLLIDEQAGTTAGTSRHRLVMMLHELVIARTVTRTVIDGPNRADNG